MPGRLLSPLETAPSNSTGGVYLTCNVAYRKQSLLLAGGFDERFPFAAFEDCDLAARLLRQGEIVWAPDAIVLHPPRPLTWRSVLGRLRHWPWVMVTGERYGYLGWPRFPTHHPKARAIWNCVVKVPAGRLLAASRALGSHPMDALRAGFWACLEPLLALCLVVPKLIRFDLQSAAFHLDHLDLASRFPPVAVVVVNYKQPELLAECIRSFERVQYPNLHLIVVESAANSSEAASLQERFPAVEWIVCPENVGYTGGNNLGIERALSRGCEYVLLANADTECIAPDMIRRLVRFLDLNPKVAVAGPRVYLRNRNQVQNTVLRYPSFFRNFIDWFGFRLWPQRYHLSGSTVRAAEMLNGVCIMLRAVALQQVGAFDPGFFMYVEDADLGLRLRRAGWQLAYVPFDSVIHHQRETGYDLESHASLLLRRNAVYFLRKHGRPIQAWSLAVANLLLALVRTCTAFSASRFRRRLSFLRSLWKEFRNVLWISSQQTPPKESVMNSETTLMP